MNKNIVLELDDEEEAAWQERFRAVRVPPTQVVARVADKARNQRKGAK